MIQKMGHYGQNLANKDYKTIIQNVWDKMNEIIEVVNGEKEYQRGYDQGNSDIIDRVKELEEALEKIVDVLAKYFSDGSKHTFLEQIFGIASSALNKSECPECEGTGEFHARHRTGMSCPECNGTGRVG